jgi:hypothetical protein
VISLSQPVVERFPPPSTRRTGVMIISLIEILRQNKMFVSIEKVKSSMLKQSDERNNLFGELMRAVNALLLMIRSK